MQKPDNYRGYTGSMIRVANATTGRFTQGQMDQLCDFTIGKKHFKPFHDFIQASLLHDSIIKKMRNNEGDTSKLPVERMLVIMAMNKLAGEATRNAILQDYGGLEAFHRRLK